MQVVQSTIYTSLFFLFLVGTLIISYKNILILYLTSICMKFCTGYFRIADNESGVNFQNAMALKVAALCFLKNASICIKFII